MKKAIFVLIWLVCTGLAFGQSNKVITAINLMKPEYLDLAKAKEAIDEAAVHPSTVGKPKTWYYRGLVYYRIYQSKDEKVKNLDPDPLRQAYLSFLKAMEFSSKTKKLESKLRFELNRCSAEYFNRASLEYEQKKYGQSVESFETVMAISRLPFINQVDTQSIYNAALSAQLAAQGESNEGTSAAFSKKAIEYYNRTIDLNWGGPEVFHYLAEVYMHLGDTVSAVKTYSAGVDKYPRSSVNLYIALINYYLNKKDLSTGFGYIEKALGVDSTNASLWEVYGSTLQKRGDKVRAAEAFKKVIDLDPGSLRGYYWLGLVYFNQGVAAQEQANTIPLSKKKEYKNAVATADEFFKQALPYFEKGYEIDKEDPQLLTGLSQIYTRFKMNDKLAIIKKQIEGKK